MATVNIRRTILWDGDHLSLAATADKVGLHYASLRYWVVKKKITTKEQLLAVIENYSIRKSEKRKLARKYGTTKGKLTTSEILQIHPYKEQVTRQTITNRARKYGYDSPCIWFPICNSGTFNDLMADLGLAKRKAATPIQPVRRKSTIDRVKQCNRVEIDERCIHKGECLNYAIDNNKDPKRYTDTNGKCYEGEICRCGHISTVPGHLKKTMRPQKK